MKLGLSYDDLSKLFNTSLSKPDSSIESVAYDSRKIINGENTLFFALNGELRNGHQYIEDAYRKNVRLFVVESIPVITLLDAQYILVENSLSALQKLAQFHRLKFNYPIIAITGSAGKTIVKEWLSQLLELKYTVVKSPKSYNSQLGVALSLLELNHAADIAIIEAGISGPNEMNAIERMIQPNYGIFTSIGSAHSENFENQEQQINEKLQLFKQVKKAIIHASIPLKNNVPFKIVANKDFIHKDVFQKGDEISLSNAALCFEMAKELNVPLNLLEEEIKHLNPLALRQETFDGINNSLIISDTYSLDIDSFRASLEYQLSISNNRKRIVVVGGKLTHSEKENITNLVNSFAPITLHFILEKEIIDKISDAVILIKGNKSVNMSRNAQFYRLKKHKTFVEVNLNAIRKNINRIKNNLPESTKVLTMVKAASYGVGLEKIGLFLERNGVDYLGVAYADEGIELRNSGVKIPILVMNAEEEAFTDCINNNLEPAIYSFSQLDEFIKSLIYLNKTNYPIHIKIETGMNRLGFDNDEVPHLLSVLSSQPEVLVKTIYSHLANSDDLTSSFVKQQADKLISVKKVFENSLPYAFECHLLNSEGALNFPEYHFDMVRLGIGIYGYSANKKNQELLNPSISWFSSISQVKKVKEGDSVGYGCAEIVKKDTSIAIIPVGYADGFRRSLSLGKGGVYINNVFCPTVGNVCMDMIMVNINNIDAKIGDTVEIFGKNQSLYSFSEQMETIPYEVLTGISKRVHRIYIED